MSNEKNNSSAPPEVILTLQEVADWLKLSARQVLRYRVPGCKLGHKTKRFLRADVLKWLEQRRSA